tara:strand:+ start:2290 stop:3354 length:1065 start_codon:yes stop_codon:yes gene_type:complete
VATYFDIHGQKVEVLSSDPSPVVEGQVWYNSTSGTAKVRGVTQSNSWASGGNHPQGGPGRYISYAAGTGTQTAGLSAGGYSPTIDGTYEYDGSTWTTGGSMPAVGYSGQMIGTQSAAFLAGGYRPGATNTCINYDGSSWTSNPATLLASPTGGPPYAGLFSWGPTNADGIFGSGANTTPAAGYTLSWNGSAFTSTGHTLNTARYSSGGSRWGSGSGSTSGLVASGNAGTSPTGGPPFSLSTASEEYNGSAWTSTPSCSVAVRGHVSCGTAVSDTLKNQGNLGGGSFSNSTETYDGSAWTTRTASPFARTYASGFGGYSQGLIFGGDTEGISPTSVESTAEWTGAYENTVTITTS